VTHDIGNMVAGEGGLSGCWGMLWRAVRSRTIAHYTVGGDRCPLPGIGHWGQHRPQPAFVALNFRGPDEEGCVQGRRTDLLDRFWMSSRRTRRGSIEENRQHYAAIYARPHACTTRSKQFRRCSNQDALDNRRCLAKGGKDRDTVSLSAPRNPSERNGGDELRFVAAMSRSA